MTLENILKKTFPFRKLAAGSALALSLYSLPLMTSCTSSNDDSDQYGNNGDVNNWSNGDDDDNNGDDDNETQQYYGICTSEDIFCDDFEGTDMDHYDNWGVVGGANHLDRENGYLIVPDECCNSPLNSREITNTNNNFIFETSFDYRSNADFIIGMSFYVGDQNTDSRIERSEFSIYTTSLDEIKMGYFNIIMENDEVLQRTESYNQLENSTSQTLNYSDNKLKVEIENGNITNILLNNNPLTIGNKDEYYFGNLSDGYLRMNLGNDTYIGINDDEYDFEGDLMIDYFLVQEL